MKLYYDDNNNVQTAYQTNTIKARQSIENDHLSTNIYREIRELCIKIS